MAFSVLEVTSSDPSQRRQKKEGSLFYFCLAERKRAQENVHCSLCRVVTAGGSA